MERNDVPLILRLEKARNELRYSVNQIAGKYDLPGYLIDLIIHAVLSEEQQQRIALMSEQITFDELRTDDEKVDVENE